MNRVLPYLAVGLAACSTACSWWLDFDDPAAATDAAGVDAAVPTWDAGPDLYEPNDTPATATGAPPGDYLATVAPRGDDDYWRLVVGEASAVVIDLRILAGDDVDLELYSISDPSTPLAWSRGVESRERIERSGEDALDPGVYLARVYGFNDDAIAHYSLRVSIRPEP